MRVLITTTVTYEIGGVSDFDEAERILDRIVDDVSDPMTRLVAVRDTFAAEVNDDGTLIANPRTKEWAD